MSMPLRSIALGAALAFTGCNSQQKTEELIQAKLEAEKARELQTQYQALKTENLELEQENDTLKLELATMKARDVATTAAPTQRRVASRDAVRKPPVQPRADRGNSSGPASPAEEADLKEQVTGGGSFK